MFTHGGLFPFERVKSQIVKQGYSRIPVYHEDPDHIIGILYIKDLLGHLDKTDFAWQSLLRAPLFVPENRKIDDILVDFQEQKNHMAIVVDEYGGTSGILTMDDILEEIVGNISDEFDEEETPYTQKDATLLPLFEGHISLKDFYRAMDFDDRQEETFQAMAGELLADSCWASPAPSQTRTGDPLRPLCLHRRIHRPQAHPADLPHPAPRGAG